MSTVSTLINWSASYLTSDVYARFLRPGAGEVELESSVRSWHDYVDAMATVLGR